VNRLASRVGVRATSVGLLLAGVAGGVYLGQGDQVQAKSVETNLVVQADAAELDLLKERHAEHAAARAPQRKAQADAAQKAAAEAKAAAGRARKLEKAAIAKKAAEKKVAEEKAAEEKRAEEKRAEEAEEAASESDSDSDSSSTSDSGGSSRPFTGPIPDSCGDYSGTREIGCAVLLSKGFGLNQMPCLDKLWKKESGWNHLAENPSSKAYGIPQALPGRKMASAGRDWRSNPATQIKWGLGYIKGRYGSPCEAWSHSRRVGWY
jgi:hypothetical protein